MSTTNPATAPQRWNTAAVAYLADEAACPVCRGARLEAGRCRACGAAFEPGIANELRAASARAAEALLARQAVLDRVPRMPAPAPASVPSPAPTLAPAPTPHDRSMDAAAAAREQQLASDHGAGRASASVQSVLAVAGAGLVAVAAIVFTFFNPDLTAGVRGAITAAVTAAFTGGAWWLARRGLRFSAEAVGALALVFLGLDVVAVADTAQGAAGAWDAAAAGTAVGGAAAVALGLAVRMRTWLFGGLLGLAAVPAMAGYAGAANGSTAAALVGHFAVAVAAFGLVAFLRIARRRVDDPLTAEAATLTAVQFLALAIALLQVPAVPLPTDADSWLLAAAVLAGVAVFAALAARHPAGGAWSAIAGASGTAALAVLPLGLGAADGDDLVGFALVATGGAVGLVVLGALVPLPAAVRRGRFVAGALTAAGASAMPAVSFGGLVLAGTVISALAGRPDQAGLGIESVSVLLGVAAAAAGFRAHAAVAAVRSGGSAGTRAIAAVGTWLGVLAALLLACVGVLPLETRIGIAVALAALGAVVVARRPNLRPSTRWPLVVGAHLAAVGAAILAGADPGILIWAGPAIVGAIALLRRTAPAAWRFVHTAAAFAYALAAAAVVLEPLAPTSIAQWCLTTAAGLAAAIGATLLTRLPVRDWYAMLAVAVVPFAIGIAQVVQERSGWTALSTGLMLLLAAALLLRDRPGLTRPLRAAAAAMLVPSAAVVVVCLGAEVLAVSASPVTLPIIAALVAIALPGAAALAGLLERRGLARSAARDVRIAVEGSALLTGAIAVGLALGREAAGLPTACLVLLVLAAGGAALGVLQRRRLGWWVAAASGTGALWTVWALAGIGAVEAYVVPPGLGAAIVGLVLTARTGRASALVMPGLLVAVVPPLTVFAVIGSGPGADVHWRGAVLLTAAWLLLAAGTLLGRNRYPWLGRAGAVRPHVLGVATLAAVAGAVQGVRFGTGADPVDTGGVPVILLCLAVGLAGAVPAALAARALPGRTAPAPGDAPAGRGDASAPLVRWRSAPALAIATVACWAGIRDDAPSTFVMYALALVLLGLVVDIARRLTAGPTSLPPVWFVFALAFVTAVVAWSPREYLRVEALSLPLGAALLAAGALHVRAARRGGAPAPAREAAEWAGAAGAGAHDRPQPPTRGRFASWPAGWGGSWALLGPGLAVTLSASVVATFTDPQTWRAILVMVLALAAILVGSGLRLAAPFLVGVLVLPIENVLVFAVQIGRGIQSMPWWITLAVVGAVLLIIAVTAERRAGEQHGLTARLRDLG